MGMDELLRDPLFNKFVKKTARMLGEWYQQKAPNMTNDELYTDSEFFPMYDENRDYSNVPEGYVCKRQDGMMMRLVHTNATSDDGIGLLSSSISGNTITWQNCWSTDPMRAQLFESSKTSPYMKGECCIYKDYIYRSLIDHNTQNPEEAPKSWKKINL